MNSGNSNNKMLRVDLTKERISEEPLKEETIRKYLGGTGIGIKYLYEEVAPGVKWSDPDNRIILATGPLGGTSVGGGSSFSLVTKGCLTDGATAVQANGYFGAFLRLSGFDGIIMHGAADRLVYLYIHDGTVEIRDATHLAGKDTWEIEGLIKQELGKSEMGCSVFSIGTAGENLVKFACIVGDKGHVAAHNGVGAVMGSKKLKAIVVSRSNKPVRVADKARLSALSKDLFKKMSGTPGTMGYRIAHGEGTQGNVAVSMNRIATATLPVKNYTTNLFPEYESFGWENVAPMFDMKAMPCWACRCQHCRIMTVREGRHAGYVGDEPEYEQFAACGPLIGVTDPLEAFVLSKEADRLGMDVNEWGWLTAWLMECYEKGLITRDDTDGIDMRWGDADAARAMLYKIAKREGVGDILAEGVKRAAEHFGAEARSLAVYTKKGNTPRTHDHRAGWQMILDTCVSDTGTDWSGSLIRTPLQVGLPADTDPFSPEVAAKLVIGGLDRTQLDDCVGWCKFSGGGADMTLLAELLEAATGWDFSAEEVTAVGRRVVTMLRVFNLRHGHTADLDAPSTRYSSAPVDGPFKGKTVAPVWRDVVRSFYKLLGWNEETSRPLPETLKKLGLEHAIKDIW
ncbi:aldehyde ferredoxin oxidoreductase family protein [Chloroflexota bacterium]